MNRPYFLSNPLMVALSALVAALLAVGALADDHCDDCDSAAVTYTNDELTQMANGHVTPPTQQTDEVQATLDTRAACKARAQESVGDYHVTAVHTDRSRHFKIAGYDPAWFRRATCDERQTPTGNHDEIRVDWTMNMRTFRYTAPKWSQPEEDESATPANPD